MVITYGVNTCFGNHFDSLTKAGNIKFKSLGNPTYSESYCGTPETCYIGSLVMKFDNLGYSDLSNGGKLGFASTYHIVLVMPVSPYDFEFIPFERKSGV